MNLYNDLKNKPAKKDPKQIWVIPYVDQPMEFWDEIKKMYGKYIKEVYTPLPSGEFQSGRPVQDQKYLKLFLKTDIFPVSTIVNPAILNDDPHKISKKIINEIKELSGNTKFTGITLSDTRLARQIKKEIKDIDITASVLMDISTPDQLSMIDDLFNTIVPSSNIVRNLNSLDRLKRSFNGKIRLMLNEACIPGCIWRTQHFYEMSNFKEPKTLCNNFLDKNPWMRLTGAWILPQHIHLFNGLYDELKLAGRVTLKKRENYIKVLGSYIKKAPLYPHQIGGGPASPLEEIEIEENFYIKTIYCKKTCSDCSICKYYHETKKKEAFHGEI